MPITITTYDEELRELVETEFFGVSEVGAMLHLSAATVRKYVREGRFPALIIGHTAYMSAPMIGAAVDSMTQHVGNGIPERASVLGVPVAPADVESLR